MKIFVIDVSGKVINYDIAFCEAIYKCERNSIDIDYFSPLYEECPECRTTRLLNLVPRKFKNGEYLWKRVLKLLELLLNYMYIIWRVARQKPDIIHFQWFPLLEVCSGENVMLKFMRYFSKHSQFVLTIHNVYPHAISEQRKSSYAKRFKKISLLLDVFIVHTEKTKDDVAKEFRIAYHDIYIVHHGIFTPSNYTPSDNIINKDEMTFIMYGNLSDYKGVDIFVESLKGLPVQYRKKIKGVIAGEMQNKELCKKLQEDSKSINVEWYPYFHPDQELYEKINSSNVIVLPYKQISQSGVLLLALYFRRYILTSDLPTFKETLKGFTDDMFFESENPGSLAKIMMNYVDGRIDTDRQMQAIEELNKQYSWQLAAEKMLKVYREIVR